MRWALVLLHQHTRIRCHSTLNGVEGGRTSHFCLSFRKHPIGSGAPSIAHDAMDGIAAPQQKLRHPDRTPSAVEGEWRDPRICSYLCLCLCSCLCCLCLSNCHPRRTCPERSRNEDLLLPVSSLRPGTKNRMPHPSRSMRSGFPPASLVGRDGWDVNHPPTTEPLLLPLVLSRCSCCWF